METTETREERDARIIAEYEQSLMAGRVFANAAASHRSRYGYEPPVSRRDFAHVMAEVAKMAAESDVMAQVAANIRVNLYGTPSQLCAQVWESIAEAVGRGYDDVVGRSGPEGGRYKVRDYTLAERLQIVAWAHRMLPTKVSGSVPSIGWCAQALVEREGVRLPR